MQDNLKHLTEPQYNELLHAIKKITTTIGPERIYCFGSRSTQVTRWSPFHAGQATEHTITVSCYDLLLVMPDRDLGYKRKIVALPSRPVNACLTIHYYALTSFEFTNRLRNNDYFIKNLTRDALLLHNSGGEAPTSNDTTIAAIANTIILHWTKAINLAHQHYRAARRAADRNDRWQVLFQLHKSATLTCTALIVLHTGHRQPPQPLAQLLYYCDNFCLIRSRVFPCNTAEETELLLQLEKAAHTAGHDEATDIPMHIVHTLLTRVEKMLGLAEGLHQQKTNTRQPALSIH